MIATSDINCGGTADIDYRFERIVESFNRWDLCERKALIRECRMFLFSRLGAVLNRSGFSIRYWKPEIKKKGNKSLDSPKGK